MEQRVETRVKPEVELIGLIGGGHGGVSEAEGKD